MLLNFLFSEFCQKIKSFGGNDEKTIFCYENQDVYGQVFYGEIVFNKKDKTITITNSDDNFKTIKHVLQDNEYNELLYIACKSCEPVLDKKLDNFKSLEQILNVTYICNNVERKYKEVIMYKPQYVVSFSRHFTKKLDISFYNCDGQFLKSFTFDYYYSKKIIDNYFKLRKQENIINL